MPGLRTSLVGRSDEFETLAAVVDATAAGQAGAGLLEGEAGIGKTRLLAEAVQYARALGLQVLAGAAGALERDRPFGALADALDLDGSSPDADRAEIGRLLTGEAMPHLAFAQAPELRFRVLEGIVALLERLSASRPALLVVDDLHWADPSTLLAVDYLLRHLTSVPVAILGAMRPAEGRPDLDRIAETVAQREGRHLMLDALDAEAVAQLAAETLSATPVAELLEQLSGAGGNPFYVTELLATLHEERAIRIENGIAESRFVEVPKSLRLIILRRLSFLPQPTLEVLRVASILGSPFALPDLSTVLGRTAVELMSLLRPALAAGILGEAGQRLGFRHDLVRDAIYFDLPLAVRSGLHLQAGRALADAGAPALQVAGHLARGAERGDADAVAWLRRAAQQAAPRAPTIAVDLLERAVELAGDDVTHDDILAEYVWGLAWSGRPAEAEKIASEVLARHDDPVIAGAVRHALGVVLWLEGRVTESLEQFERLLRQDGLSETDRAIVLARLTLRRLLSGDLPGAEAAAHEALDAAERSGYELAASEALGALCWVVAARGDLEEAIGFGRRAIALSARNEDPGGTFIAPRLYPQSRVYLGATLVDADQLDEAEDMLQQGRRIAEQQGADWALPVFHVGLAYARYLAGQWDDAVAEIETAVSLADEIGTRNGIVFALSILATIALRRDDVALAERTLDRLDAEIAATGAAHYRVHWGMRARAMLEEARGNAPVALAILEAAWTVVSSTGITAEQRELGPSIVRLSLAGGDAKRAGEVAAALDTLATRADVPSVRAAALRCHALIDADPDAAERAVEEFRASGRIPDIGAAAEDAAAIAARAGRTEDAVRLLDEALSVYDTLGAAADAARADAALRALGIRRGRKRRRAGARTGWESLTQTEMEVVRLAAEGLTNREIGQRLFVSRRTVETHLSHVFGKLSVTTRVQLAAEATRAGIGKT